jgi:hypothetical protein
MKTSSSSRHVRRGIYREVGEHILWVANVAEKRGKESVHWKFVAPSDTSFRGKDRAPLHHLTAAKVKLK